MASPTISSALPSPYISAVSISRMPSSSPSRTAASSAALAEARSPMRQVPRPSTGTFSPVMSVTVRIRLILPRVVLTLGGLARRCQWLTPSRPSARLQATVRPGSRKGDTNGQSAARQRPCQPQGGAGRGLRQQVDGGGRRLQRAVPGDPQRILLGSDLERRAAAEEDPLDA